MQTQNITLFKINMFIAEMNFIKCIPVSCNLCLIMIDRINERIDLLKVGLSGIAKRYGYQTVQDFYRAYHTAKNAYADYQNKAAKWEETYGTKVNRDTVHGRIQNYQRE